MTFHRFLYKLCWRSRYVLPLVFAAIIIVTALYSGPGTSVEYTPDGKARLQYKHRHGLVPRLENLQPHPLVHPEQQSSLDSPNYHNGHGHSHMLGDVPAVHLVPRKPSDSQLHFHGGKDLHRETKIPTEKSQEADIQHQMRIVTNASIKYNNHKVKSKTRHQHNRKETKLKPGWKTSVYYDPRNPPDLFVRWDSMREKLCEGKFVGYMNEFAHVNHLLVDLRSCTSPRKGGEEIKEVLDQPEEHEYFTYSMGCFQMPCLKRPSYYFNNKNHLNEWMMNMKTKGLYTGAADKLISEFTIGLMRYEYANIYHTMTDWYNAFMIMQFFNKTQRETNILFVDTHPLGALDAVWRVLFNSTVRMASLPEKTVFTDMAWNILGYNSPMLEFYSQELPLIEEFREFFLSSYRINTARLLDCQKLSILFIWRKDYLAHPRNPEGTVSRKFYKEKEMLNAVQKKFIQHQVKGLQIDLFDMDQQLQFISDADILVGMHGAGLTHVMFLQKHAGVIEIVPNYFSSSNEHFSAIASWRKLHYQKWVNLDPENEVPGDQTMIPSNIIIDIVQDMTKRVCAPHVMSNESSYRQHEMYFEPKYIEASPDPDNYARPFQNSLSVDREAVNISSVAKTESIGEQLRTAKLSPTGFK